MWWVFFLQWQAYSCCIHKHSLWPDQPQWWAIRELYSVCVSLLKIKKAIWQSILSGDLTVYRFQFHHFVQHFHSHQELQGGTKQKDTNTSECDEIFVEEKWPLRGVCEVGCVCPAPHVKAACERVSDVLNPLSLLSPSPACVGLVAGEVGWF